MKSSLQLRAESACESFTDLARGPLVIEFAGTPKAGKTSTLGQLQSFLKRCGFRVSVVVERASVCPIRDKKHSNFNVWTACTTLAQILEKTQDPPRQDDPQILILDRGLFDAICWLSMMDRLSRLRSVDREIIERFLTLDDWRKRVSGVILMTANPDDAMEREAGHLPVEATGSIMNRDVLEQVLRVNTECAERWKDEFDIFVVDTSSQELRGQPKRTAEVVADRVLALIERHLQEEILHLSADEVTPEFGKGVAIGAGPAMKLISRFISRGRFDPRSTVEPDASRIQALPVVVVRNKTGDVLRLRRRERDKSNSLHEKLVVWAGGHVRREDSERGDPIIECLLRELQEELRLSVEPTELTLIGAVYANGTERSSKHVALVYEWRALTDDVAITLSTAEFFERRGTSLSGKFVPLERLAGDVNGARICEPWSRAIIDTLLPS